MCRTCVVSYGNSAQAASTRGGHVAQLLRGHVEDLKEVSCDEDGCVAVHHLQVGPLLAVVTERVASGGSRTTKQDSLRKTIK